MVISVLGSVLNVGATVLKGGIAILSFFLPAASIALSLNDKAAHKDAKKKREKRKKK